MKKVVKIVIYLMTKNALYFTRGWCASELPILVHERSECTKMVHGNERSELPWSMQL